MNEGGPRRCEWQNEKLFPIFQPRADLGKITSQKNKNNNNNKIQP